MKWIYLERYAFHTQNAVRLKRLEQPQRMGLSRKVRAAKGETNSSEYGSSQEARGPRMSLLRESEAKHQAKLYLDY